MPFCAMLNYPLLASKLIFEDVDAGQLFELSRLSKKMEQKIKDSGIRCKTHSVSFTRDPAISINFTNYKKLEIIFNQPFPKNAKIRCGSFNDLKFNYARIDENKFLICPEQVSTFRGVFQSYDHIAGVFPTKLVAQLDVDVDKVKNLIGLMTIPEFSNCQTLQLIGGEMEEEDAKYIQENCQIHETLVLNGKVGKRDQHSKMFEVKNLVVKDNKWINLQDLIWMKCENIYIKDSSITDLDLVELVTMWKNGDTNQRLKTLQVEFFGGLMFPTIRPSALPRLPERFQRIQIEEDSSDSDDSEDSEDSDDSDEEDNEIREQQRRAEILERHQMHVEQVREQNDMEISEEEDRTGWKLLQRKQMNLNRHGQVYVRGEENYSKFIEEPEIITLDSFYRDVERFDGTIASISIHMNTFKMVVWHEFELPPL